MRLGIIPARGGSKRIPHKNIKLFHGRPILAWSIDAALSSGCFDRIIVSTDDAEIADVAERHGATVPFLRPEALSDDHTATTPVIKHAVEWCDQYWSRPELACCIYATAPFIRSVDIAHGLSLMKETGCDFAFTVTGYGSPIQRALRLGPDGRVEMLYPDQFDKRSQDLEQAYHDAGQFYWGTYSAWTEQRPLFSNRAVPLVLPRYRVQDIDTPDDWVRAERMFVAVNQSVDTR